MGGLLVGELVVLGAMGYFMILGMVVTAQGLWEVWKWWAWGKL